jgi:hypothetical protein
MGFSLSAGARKKRGLIPDGPAAFSQRDGRLLPVDRIFASGSLSTAVEEQTPARNRKVQRGARSEHPER